jgi:hypothetical protein
MRVVKSKNRRRATILLLVVSLLALLFVIVTGFLSLSRNTSRLGEDISRSDLIDAIVEDMDDWAVSLVKEQIVDDAGNVLPGGSGQTFSSEDIPGYRRSNYLAALEPVWVPGAFIPSALSLGSWSVLGALCWPALTSLDDAITTPQAIPLFRLLRDYDFDDGGVDRYDVRWNARNPFMDADGDGVPDSHFLLCAPATEAANTMAGTSVSLPRYDPSDPTGQNGAFVTFRIPPPLGNWEGGGAYNGQIWQRYDQHARYEVAMRIVSHGGMVTLDSPTLYSQNGSVAYLPFNRSFTIDLFDSIREGSRSMREQYSNLTEQNRLFDQLQASTAAVEASLRRRYTLPSPPDEVYHFDAYRRVPPILAELQGETNLHLGFRPALIPSFTYPAPLTDYDNYQRINIGVEAGSGDERLGWARAVARNPTEYNVSGGSSGGGQGSPAVQYNQRHFITTINNSDELARKQEPNDPQPTATTRLDLGAVGNRGSTYGGELKFYLGEVAKAFREVDPTGATQAGTGWYSYDVTRGNLVVERLARFYYDMLRSHSSSGATPDDWGDATDANDNGPEAASRRQQAFMLAVNTVAFAAPRSTDLLNAPGFIPVVSYADVTSPGVAYDNSWGNGPGADDVRYTGYTPQPFFSEVIAYREADADPNDPNYVSDPNDPAYDDPNVPNLVLAVELYNPNTPCYNGTTDAYGLVDVHGLWLGQFAISVNGAHPGDPNEVGASQELGTAFGFSERLNGRTFMRLVIENDQSSHFDVLVNPNAPDFAPKIELDLEEDLSEPETLTLWRWDWRDDGAGGAFKAWFPVDEIEIANSWPGTGFWKSAYRDTSPNREYAAPDYEGDGIFEYARWNVITRRAAAAPAEQAGPHIESIGNSAWLQLAESTPDPAGEVKSPDVIGALPVAFSPTTTLITMNAGPVSTFSGEPLYQQFNNLPMFGNPNDLRPRSFPTVGFLLFVPRFAHMQKIIAGASNPIIPMSETLAKQWSNQGYALSSTYLRSVDYPADFGHMPLFDNTQNVPSGSYFDSGQGVGPVPWGQLVFDYFTTIDPTRDVNGDREPDVDPLRVPGRININTAPWFVLANLPLLGPDDTNDLPVRPFGTGTGVPVSATEPSPAFWDPFVGMLVGWDSYGVARLLAQDPAYTSGSLFEYSVPYAPPYVGLPVGRYRLGPWLAQSAAAYRDGVQYVPNNASYLFYVYSDAQERNLGGAFYKYRADARYGTMRGQAPSAGSPPTQFGFVSVGELLNVKGMDSSTDVDLVTLDVNGAASANSAVARGDFLKAVSIVALLDSQYLTTRSNTFTVYTSVMDRQEPEASVRSQVTVDRSNLLPRLTYAYSCVDLVTGGTIPCDSNYLLNPAFSNWPLAPLLLDLDGDALAIRETPVRTTNGSAIPEVVAKERVGYFNTSHDD